MSLSYHVLSFLIIETQLKEIKGTHSPADEQAISEALQRYKVGGLTSLSSYDKFSLGPPILDHEIHRGLVMQGNQEAVLIYRRQG